MMNQWIWISWEAHRRTRELCKELGIRLYERTADLPRIIKHPYLLIWTAFTLARLRPKGLIVQSPSIFLSLWAALLKKVFGYALVIDAHNGGVIPLSKWHKRLPGALKYIHKEAELTIVTNQNLAEIVTLNGGHPFVLEDKVPALRSGDKKELKEKHPVVCISTFAIDEPIEEIVEAARLLIDECTIFVTGNFKKLPARMLKEIPPNLRFTGFLSEEEYISLLKGCEVILDLTTIEDCLVCGAYEAVALEKPVVLTNTDALKRYFCRGAVYTNNTATDIRSAVVAAIANKKRLTAEARLLKFELDRDWFVKKEGLVCALHGMTDERETK